MANEGIWSDAKTSARGGFNAAAGYARNIKDVGVGGAHASIGAAGYAAYGARGALNTKIGGAVKRGVAETFGFQHYKGVSEGWLGWKKTGYGEAYLKGSGDFTAKGAPAQRTFSNIKHAGMRDKLTASRKAKITAHQAEVAVGARRAGKKAAWSAAKKGGIGMAAGTAGKLAMGGISPAFAAANVVHGYKTGGVSGAAGAFAEEVAMFAAFELVGSATVIGGGLVAGAAYGAYQALGAAQEHHRGLRKLEMGGTLRDPFGTISTTRQRSLMALNNSHINGRMALGQEASLMHTNAYGG